MIKFFSLTTFHEKKISVGLDYLLWELKVDKTIMNINVLYRWLKFHRFLCILLSSFIKNFVILLDFLSTYQIYKL